jgi:hypothetical protein
MNVALRGLLLVQTLLLMPANAEDCRVLVGGSGCRTRQLAIERIFEELPGVHDVEILPRKVAPAPNQRVFLIRSTGKAPTREQLITALGRRARHYLVLEVTSEANRVGGSPGIK